MSYTTAFVLYILILLFLSNWRSTTSVHRTFLAILAGTVICHDLHEYSRSLTAIANANDQPLGEMVLMQLHALVIKPICFTGMVIIGAFLAYHIAQAFTIACAPTEPPRRRSGRWVVDCLRRRIRVRWPQTGRRTLMWCCRSWRASELQEDTNEDAAVV